MYFQVFLECTHHHKNLPRDATSSESAGGPTDGSVLSLIRLLCFWAGGGSQSLVGRGLCRAPPSALGSLAARATASRPPPRGSRLFSPRLVPPPSPRAPPPDRRRFVRATRASVSPEGVPSVGARAARDHVLRDLGGDPHGPGHLRAHRARLRALAHHQGDPGAPPARVRRSPPPRRARAPRAPARGFRSFSRLPRSPFPAIAPRSPPRPLSDRPSTPHHPLNPSRASSIVVLRRARNERTGDGRVPRDEAAPGAG